MQDRTETLRDLGARVGEEAAQAEVVRWLRWAAAQIESGEYPRLMSAVVPVSDWERRAEIAEIHVFLSHPWPG